MAIAMQQHTCVNATYLYCIFLFFFFCKCFALVIVLVHFGVAVLHCNFYVFLETCLILNGCFVLGLLILFCVICS